MTHTSLQFIYIHIPLIYIYYLSACQELFPRMKNNHCRSSPLWTHEPRNQMCNKRTWISRHIRICYSTSRVTWAAIVSTLLLNCYNWIQLSNTQSPSRLLHICLNQQHICQYHLRLMQTVTTIFITRRQLLYVTTRAYITGIKNIRFIATRLATNDSQVRSRPKGKNVFL